MALGAKQPKWCKKGEVQLGHWKPNDPKGLKKLRSNYGTGKPNNPKGAEYNI